MPYPLISDPYFTDDEDLRKELQNHFNIEATAQLPGWRIGWENFPLNPDPNNTESWLEFTHETPSTLTACAYSERKLFDTLILVTVSVNVPLNVATGSLTRAVAAIKSIYPGSFSLRSLRFQPGVAASVLSEKKYTNFYTKTVYIPLQCRILL